MELVFDDVIKSEFLIRQSLGIPSFNKAALELFLYCLAVPILAVWNCGFIMHFFTVPQLEACCFFTALRSILSQLISFVDLFYQRTLPVSPQIAWFEVLAHNAKALHSGRTRTFAIRASCTTSNFVYRRWTHEDSAKAKRTRDLCKKWGVILDSIEPSLIDRDSGMLVNHLKWGMHLPHLLSGY